MARTGMSATRVKPAVAQLLTLHVLRSERISPSFVRVTLGGGEVERFAPMGFDQWFRLFLPVSDASLSRLPNRLDTLAYLRYLAIARTDRPVLRNYTVRAFRDHGPDGAELDVDFVLHGSVADGTSGPAAAWAQTCRRGDAVAILDEGITFHPPEHLLRRVRVVVDETGLPAAAGILSSLPRDAAGVAVLEIPERGDAQDLTPPEHVTVEWVVREEPDAVPGAAALARAVAEPLDHPFYGWIAGEQRLATELRRHWVRSGAAKTDVTFGGYWKSRARH
ncbi:siderophore-interacting protein [Georgenia sp. TF02-10]|uniref:siderophore-interacting protein n=1 Tax=Georgenia sp. TF02-10 TaxID=2917725 RepID=UPI001FA7A26C|nr:siderophore-interacting protein [Georgenia sp. TF02-10]UNX56149.1 siderophore-interacting protein [Georgenia sp. TF02-10]